jgi:hypothetical protein
MTVMPPAGQWATSGREAFMRVLEAYGIMPPLEKGTVSRLERIMASLDEVEEWRQTLTPKQRIEWSSPRSIISHCPAFRPARPQETKRRSSPR